MSLLVNKKGEQMAIPIKAQMSINSRENDWVKVVMLTDGSLYMVDCDYTVFPVNRSYAGHAIKTYMKEVAREYHTNMFYASLARRNGDLFNAISFRQSADGVNVIYKEVKKFWNTFKNMSVRHKKEKNTNVQGFSYRVNLNNNVICDYDNLSVPNLRQYHDTTANDDYYYFQIKKNLNP